MSSATPTNPTAARRMAGALSSNIARDAGSRSAAGAGTADVHALSPRQHLLDWRWRFYCTEQYSGRKRDWNGDERLGLLESEMVGTTGFVPEGFYDAGGTLPLKYRCPTAPYHLARVIVDRFTGLLFGAERHPSPTVPGDPATEDWLKACVEAMRLWARMLEARAMGGSMGAVAIGFKVLDGAPMLDVFDPRFTRVKRARDGSGRVVSVVVQELFTEELRNANGEWEEVEFLYRREIDAREDRVWERVPVPRDNREPDWTAIAPRAVAHGFGECPVVWIQNRPAAGGDDGDPDLLGCYDTIEAIDALVAQAHRGVLKNADPTLHLGTDADLDSVAKGSDNALKLEPQSKAQYLEITGAGARAAWELAEKLEDRVYRMARCVPDWRQNAAHRGARTATEVDKDTASMHEACDVLREQYGELGVKRLLELVLRVARRLGRPRPEMTGPADAAGLVPVRLVRETIQLPPKVETDPETKVVTVTPRALGPEQPWGDYIVLKWPPYQKPSLDDATKAATAVATARGAKVLGREQAAEFLAPYFGVEDVAAMLAQLDEEAADAQARLEAEVMARMATGAGTEQPGGGGDKDGEDDPALSLEDPDDAEQAA